VTGVLFQLMISTILLLHLSENPLGDHSNSVKYSQFSISDLKIMHCIYYVPNNKLLRHVIEMLLFTFYDVENDTAYDASSRSQLK